MPEQLFDRAAEYQEMLNQGIGLSGEGQEYFIAGRIQDMRAQVPPAPGRILDFGCGIGKSCEKLAQDFPGSRVIGADLSAEAIQYAQNTYGSDRVSFANIGDLPDMEPFDLCYINGVFHHIPPSERQSTLTMIRQVLTPGAHLALFENNPWNPGTRMVMSRIPFDRDAIPLSYLETRRRVRAAGFEVCAIRFLFYMPNALAALRFVEPWLVSVPLGAQYCVLGRNPK